MIKLGIECESIEGKNPMWGVGRLIIGLLKEISRWPELEKDFRFVLYFKDSIPDFPFLNASIFEKKRVPVPFFKNRLFPIYYFALLPIKLWFERLDWMFWPNYMLPIIAFNKSVVMLTEDIYYETHAGKSRKTASRDKLPFRYRLAYGIFGWWTAKFATKIMAISETSKKNTAKLYGINPDRIFVNYLGVKQAPTVYKPPTTANQESVVRSRLAVDNYLLFVGQVFPRRHLRETILAFEKLVTKHSNILPPSHEATDGQGKNIGMLDLKFIAIGPDKYEKPVIKSLVENVNRRLGREAVIHKDYVKDSELVALYAGAKALIYVSDREAFGLPPMEALAFGVPPVIMDNELGHELFGEYAIYSKSGETDDIAEAVKQALSDENPSTELRARIKNSGPEFVKKYNWKSFADNFFKIIQK